MATRSPVSFIGGLFDSNEGELRKLRKIAARINELEPEIQRKTDEELAQSTLRFRDRLAKGESLDDILTEVFASVREAAKRTLKQRHFDVQLMGGLALHKGHIAEMRTGEGKTLVASLALYANALEGKGAHLVTTNDYLAKTGAGWMAPIYQALGATVAYIAHEKSAIYDPAVELDAVDPRHRHWRDVSRRQAYEADITYGQNSEFGFDYLRDNMAMDLNDQVQQRGLHYAIVDEADSILIDEARTPLIISSPAEDATETYYTFARVAAQLQPDTDYVIEEKQHAVTLTEEGISRAEKLLRVKNMYEGDVTAVHYLDNAVRARALYRKDKEYVVKDGEVIIVDEFTGRLMPGRRWSDGLHQAVEAKEGLKIQRETRTFATITIQNYFRMYTKLAGMTGTAATEAEELFKVYKLEVTQIPTNKPMVRKDNPDLVYKTEQGKWDAVVAEVKERNEAGQPVLIGTTSVEKSERLSDQLRRHGIKHEVLNAKNHEREALIIADAGQRSAVTLSTNMAGRGVDILLGEGITDLGGLHIIGTERHEARRIDNQLRGRSGRQGDPGSSRFFSSLEDDLIRIFASERVAGLMARLGFDDSTPIESGMVTGAITQAQVKVEGRNFDIRKRALEFDDVLNNQRTVIYGQRRLILEKGDVRETVLEFLRQEADGLVDTAAATPDPEDWDREKLAAGLGAMLNRPDLVATSFGELRNQNELRDRVAEIVEETYEAREKELGEELTRAVERWVLLRTIDTHWIEHLTAMEELREGIYLLIYGQRRLILEKGDVRETVLEFLRQEADGLVDTAAATPDPEDWDREKLAAGLGAMLNRPDLVATSFGELRNQNELRDRVAEIVEETYEAREKELGEELTRAVERWVLLRTIDTHWIEHLTAMEELREGIYLRGYGQQDPLVAYKREAHGFFEEMEARIASGVAQTILRVTVRTAEQAEQEEKTQTTKTGRTRDASAFRL
ncbi:MAG: preprotein translocase subunit SecA [Chloroflexi bacterium]|nr:MAG: preprotein translocase subunit SecA [Chloroflexota bacterium]